MSSLFSAMILTKYINTNNSVSGNLGLNKRYLLSLTLVTKFHVITIKEMTKQLSMSPFFYNGTNKYINILTVLFQEVSICKIRLLNQTIVTKLYLLTIK